MLIRRTYRITHQSLGKFNDRFTMAIIEINLYKLGNNNPILI